MRSQPEYCLQLLTIVSAGLLTLWGTSVLPSPPTLRGTLRSAQFPPLSWARQFCQKKCARPFLSATSRLSGGVRYPSPRGAGSLGRSSPYSFQRATNARHADLLGCERNQEQKGTHKTVHVPKDDRSSSCQGHLGLWRVRASVPVQCPHLRQTAQARPPGTESEGRWGS